METKKGRYSFRGWTRAEWVDYLASVGTVAGVAFLTAFLGIVAFVKHIQVPQIAYTIPVGFIMFVCGWIWDAQSHRSIWKDAIDRAELNLHYYMVYAGGFTSFICLVLAYWWPSFMAPFIFGFLGLKCMYSVYDELHYHQTRLREGRSDNIEASAHAIQFLSNCVFDFGWVVWIYKYGYQGAGEVVSAAFSMLRHLF